MTPKKIALITGVTGQDGAYLAELLPKKGHEVHGIKRCSSLFNTDRIDHLYQDSHAESRNFILHNGDMTDSSNLIRIVQQVQPDEIYNLAAQSHVAVSFEEPEYTGNADGIGALRLLEAIRLLGREKKTRFGAAWRTVITQICVLPIQVLLPKARHNCVLMARTVAAPWRAFFVPTPT